MAQRLPSKNQKWSRCGLGRCAGPGAGFDPWHPVTLQILKGVALVSYGTAQSKLNYLACFSKCPQHCPVLQLPWASQKSLSPSVLSPLAPPVREDALKTAAWVFHGCRRAQEKGQGEDEQGGEPGRRERQKETLQPPGVRPAALSPPRLFLFWALKVTSHLFFLPLKGTLLASQHSSGNTGLLLNVGMQGSRDRGRGVLSRK